MSVLFRWRPTRQYAPTGQDASTISLLTGSISSSRLSFLECRRCYRPGKDVGVSRTIKVLIQIGMSGVVGLTQKRPVTIRVVVMHLAAAMRQGIDSDGWGTQDTPDGWWIKSPVFTAITLFPRQLAFKFLSRKLQK